MTTATTLKGVMPWFFVGFKTRKSFRNATTFSQKYECFFNFGLSVLHNRPCTPIIYLDNSISMYCV